MSTSFEENVLSAIEYVSEVLSGEEAMLNDAPAYTVGLAAVRAQEAVDTAPEGPDSPDAREALVAADLIEEAEHKLRQALAMLQRIEHRNEF